MNQPSASNHAAATEDCSPYMDETYMDATLYDVLAKGKVNMLESLLQDKDLRLQLTPKRNTILHIAAQFGQLQCVEWILHQCLPSSSSSSSSLLQQPNLKGDTPLHLAAREGHCQVVLELTATAKALQQEIESEVEAEKAILRMENKEKDTALHEAVRYHHSEVVKLLIKEDPEFVYGANITGHTPLYMAAERGYGDLVKIIIDNTRTSPAHHGIMGRTALHAAVIGNHQDITARLLEWKPSLTKEVDERGWSPLHCAAYFGYVKIVKQLLDKSLDKSPTYLRITDGKKTALHIAAGRGHIDIVKLLVRHCPDCCEQVDCKGQNVFHFAMAKEKDDYPGEFLEIDGLQLRGLVNEKDVEGDTPLHLLASYLVDDEDFIVNHTVDKMGLNSKYFTPHDMVSQATRDWVNKSYILKYLRKSKEGGVGPLSWLPGIKEDQRSGESKNKDEDRTQKKDNQFFFTLEKKAETHLIVATLITTVTFAAGFTVPGGYKEDKDSSPGTAVLAKKAAFKAFVVTDTIAMVLSISAVFVSFLMVYHKKQEIIGNSLLWATLLTMFAMGAMVVAFMTGLYAVLPLSSGLPVATCVICCVFFIFFYYLFRQILKDED